MPHNPIKNPREEDRNVSKADARGHDYHKSRSDDWQYQRVKVEERGHDCADEERERDCGTAFELEPPALRTFREAGTERQNDGPVQGHQEPDGANGDAE